MRSRGLNQAKVAAVSRESGERATVTFTTIEHGPFTVEIPAGDADAVGRALSAGPGALLETWLLAELVDGDLTEILIEDVGGQLRFSFIISSLGLLTRIRVDPADAVVTGLRLNVPFLVAGHPNGSRERAALGAHRSLGRTYHLGEAI